MAVVEEGARLSPARRVRALLSYGAARAVETLLLSLPPSSAEGIARATGGLVFRLDRRRRATALENLRIAFPSLAEGDRSRIARASCSHALVVAVEAVRRPRVLRRPRDFGRRGRYFGDIEAMADDVRAGRAGVLLGGHFGNWELTAACLLAEGLPLSFVARSFRNPYLDAHVARTRGGVDAVIFKGGAVRASQKALERGRWVGFLSDQNAGSRGMFVPFFGLPASTFSAGALLAAREGRPVYFGAAVRRGPEYRYDYEIRRCALVPTGDATSDARRMLDAFHAYLEQRVREHPEQYFWLHRRWKTRPPGEDPATDLPRYPEDAKRRKRGAPPRAAAPHGE